jgi:murein DD-endopeptidase MepM/ murein hydrolase activator NlpD
VSLAFAFRASIGRSIGITALALVALTAPAAARAAPSYVEVRDPTGRTIATGIGAAYDYPEDGSVVHVGGASQTATGIELSNVVLLDGRVRADTIDVPAHGFAGLRVDGLVVDDTTVDVSAPNTIAAVPGAGYLVAAQAAIDGANQAAVGLRIHLLATSGSLPSGTELLIAPSGARTDQPSAELGSTPISVLGFSLGADGFVQGAPVGYPLAARGVISACPFTPGSSHSAFVPPNNLESDDAVDIDVPVGTPVLAVADGVIGPQIGSLHSANPRMQGLRVHLDTPTHRYYYAHLSRIDVVAGQHVTAGQQLGLSGSAAGLAHLHFAQDGGNPAVTIGEPTACPFFVQYDEAW